MRIEQNEKYQGEDWWDWSVWVEGTVAELKQIASVTYILHSTFRGPVRIVTTHRNKFKLKSEGYGGFTIYAKVMTKTGKMRTLKHALELHYLTAPV